MQGYMLATRVPNHECTKTLDTNMCALCLMHVYTISGTISVLIHS